MTFVVCWALKTNYLSTSRVSSARIRFPTGTARLFFLTRHRTRSSNGLLPLSTVRCIIVVLPCLYNSALEALAKGTLQECYIQNPEKACSIVKKKAAVFCLPPLAVAIAFNIRAFVAEPASSDVLDSVWAGKVRSAFESETIRGNHGSTFAFLSELSQRNLFCPGSYTRTQIEKQVEYPSFNVGFRWAVLLDARWPADL